ncbi:cylicin-1 [Capricornis sumatraensis]|uniref:cylicin-1 n=1 Tax=Capricornis sumatraensis TaxID=34865 RepID=UPI003604395D
MWLPGLLKSVPLTLQHATVELCLHQRLLDTHRHSTNPIKTFSFLNRQEITIKTYDNSIPIGETSKKLWNQQYFTITFPKSSQPGGKKRLRPSEIQITVPRHDKRNLDELQKPAHIWIRHSLRKKFQSPSINLTVMRQASFRHPYTHISHSKKVESKKYKDDKKGAALKKISKKDTGPHEIDEKPERGNKAEKTPSKSSHGSQLSKESKSKSETNPESKDSIPVSIKHQKREKIYSRDSKEMDFESISTKKYSKSSKNNSDALSETCSKNSSNVDLMVHLGESDAETMEFDMWLKNYSQNNSKKPTKKDAKKDAKGKGSDAESADSKDAKKDGNKDKKGSTKDTKKDAKKDTESTDTESGDSKDAKKGKKESKKDKKMDAKKDAAKKMDAKKDAAKKMDAKKDAASDAESGDSKDAKKDLKKGKKDSKIDDKKKDAKKDAESTDAESGDSKDAKKDSKKDKKDDKKDAKKDVVSTDADSESEADAKKSEKDSKKDKKDLKKHDKKKSTMKSGESTETESDWESKKVKRDSKKDVKKSAKDTESSGAESDVSSKRYLKKTEMFKSSDAESEESLFKPGPKKRVDESDATSTDSKKDAVEPKRGIKMSSRRTTFKEKGKKIGTGRVPPSRERLPLSPCEPILPSPRVKHLCRCQMPPPPLKPRYAPLDTYDLNVGAFNNVLEVVSFHSTSKLKETQKLDLRLNSTTK